MLSDSKEVLKIKTMENSTGEDYSLTDIANNLKLLIKYLLKKWWLLVFALVVSGIAGALLHSYQKPKYEAVCTFILEEKQSGIGGLGSIASQFGIDFGASGGGSIFSGDNILDILKSKYIVQNVLLSKVDSNKGPETLIDLFLASAKWKEKNGIDSIDFSHLKSNQDLTLQQDSVLGLVHEYLSKKSIIAERLNKKGSIVQVSVTAPNQYFAKLFSDRVVNESKLFYIKIKTNAAQLNVSRLERKADSLLALLNNKSYQAATAVVLDANPAIRSLNVPAELKQRDKTILGTLYGEVVKNLELSRLSLSEQTPVIQILDQASYPLKDKKYSAVALIGLFSFGGLLITAMVLGLKFIVFRPNTKTFVKR